jgi:hypothetical protein
MEDRDRASLSIKASWCSEKRKLFELKLMNYGWTALNKDTFEKGNTRIELDNWGLFVFQNGVDGKWNRVAGLSDDRVSGPRSKRALVGPFNAYGMFNLESCRFTGTMVAE